MVHRSRIYGIAFLSLLLAATASHAFFSAKSALSTGYTPSELFVGMSTALSGPAQNLGNGVKAGVEAAFEEVNAKGGVQGRRLTLKAFDDAHDPLQTGPQMRKLITEENVFAILGNVGTPTAVVGAPVANEFGIPFFGAFTGTGLLRRNPPDRFIINFRASYADETREIIRGLTQDLKIKPLDIAFFTQNDAYGDAGYNGSLQALHEFGFTETDLLTHGRYRRNTENVEDALAKILEKKSKPRAIVMVGTSKASAKFIHLARKNGLNQSLFVNVSFVGSQALLNALDFDSDGVIVTQVVPHFDSPLPIIQAYKKRFSTSERNFVSEEGFIIGQAFAKALEKAGPNPTRDDFIDAVENLKDVDIGLDRTFTLSKDDHQFSHAVYPTIIHQKEFQKLEWKTLLTAARKRGGTK